MLRKWILANAAAQIAGGIGLLAWAALFYGLSGWGVGFSDLKWQLTAVLPWLSPIATGPIIEARQTTEGRRRLVRVAVICVLATLVTVVSSIAGRVEYPSDPAPLPWPLLLLLVPVGVALMFLGFVALAIPAIAARTSWGRVLAWIPFSLGLIMAAYPESLFEFEHLREWLLVTVAMLVSLGLALLATGGAWLLTSRTPETRQGPGPREFQS